MVPTFIEESVVGYMLFLLDTFKHCLFFADLLSFGGVRFLRGLLNLGMEGQENILQSNPTSLSFTLFVIYLRTYVNYRKTGEAVNLVKGKTNFSMT